MEDSGTTGKITVYKALGGSNAIGPFFEPGGLEEKLQQLLLSFADYVIFEKDDQYKVYAMTGYTATISDGSTPVPEGVPYVAAEYSPNF